jgi:rhodanese-related sulfurtransferase
MIMAKASIISPQQASQMVKSNTGRFIDVRTVGEVLAEELPGSVFLPFDLVSKARLEEMGVAETTPILVCRSGSRAKQAAEALAQEMDEVAVLDGGIVRWKDEGLATEIGRKVIPLERQVLVAAGLMMLLFTLLGLMASPLFLIAAVFMSCGMIFAGATGACGMARILLLLPWNKAPMCGSACALSESSQTT